MVCVVCSCCAISPYREVCRAKGGIGSGETLCHDIYPAKPITTVSLAANTYCMMDGNVTHDSVTLIVTFLIIIIVKKQLNIHFCSLSYEICVRR